MVWAAVGEAGVIGPFFFEGNMDADSYLKLLEEEFFPVFSGYSNQSELLFLQDGAPPHWAQRVRDWLNDHLANRSIGRGVHATPTFRGHQDRRTLLLWISSCGASSRVRYTRRIMKT